MAVQQPVVDRPVEEVERGLDFGVRGDLAAVDRPAEDRACLVAARLNEPRSVLAGEHRIGLGLGDQRGDHAGDEQQGHHGEREPPAVAEPGQPGHKDEQGKAEEDAKRRKGRQTRTRLPAAIVQGQRSRRYTRRLRTAESATCQRRPVIAASGACAGGRCCSDRAGGFRREHAERPDPVRAGAPLWEGWPRARRSATSSSHAGPARGSRAGRGSSHRRRCSLLATAEHVGKAECRRDVYLREGSFSICGAVCDRGGG